MTDSLDLGVRLSDAAPFVAALKALLIEESELLDVEQMIPDRDRVTVYLANHGSFIAPFPAPVLTVEHLLARGGYDDLVAVTLFHKVAELIPGLSPVLRRYLGHSTPKLRSVRGLVELMRARRFHLLGTAPEGWASLLTWEDPIGALTKVGLMVAAFEADADLVLAVQKGVEVFGRAAPLPGGLRLPIKGRPTGLLFPSYVPGRRAKVRVRYERFTPSLSFEQRQRLTPTERRAWNQQEFERVRLHMNALYRSIPEW